MRGQIRKYFMALMLCFSCILLFKSGYIRAYGAEQMREGVHETAMEEEGGELISSNCVNGKTIRIYLDGKSYVAVDVIFLVVVMVFVFMLVLEKK